MTFLALDFETTGLDAGIGRVVEVGAVRFELAAEGPIEKAALASLVAPGIPIPWQARSIHGISDEDVADAPRFAELAQALLELAKGAVIVGHNVGFDLGFLDGELMRAGILRQHLESADTVPLARKAFPGHRSYKLTSIAADLRIDAGASHRALDDARTCMKLYAACMAALAAREGGRKGSPARSLPRTR